MDALVVLSIDPRGILIVMSKMNRGGWFFLCGNRVKRQPERYNPMNNQPQTQIMHPISPPDVVLPRWGLQTLFFMEKWSWHGTMSPRGCFSSAEIEIWPRWPWIPTKLATNRSNSIMKHKEVCWCVNMSIEDFWNVKMGKILARTKHWK